ncbi:MAG: hypothetical protein AVDCRST_MAG05-4193, partial [uncultured Rubrobacteraceae bacterium]
ATEAPHREGQQHGPRRVRLPVRGGLRALALGGGGGVGSASLRRPRRAARGVRRDRPGRAGGGARRPYSRASRPGREGRPRRRALGGVRGRAGLSRPGQALARGVREVPPPERGLQGEVRPPLRGLRAGQHEGDDLRRRRAAAGEHARGGDSGGAGRDLPDLAPQARRPGGGFADGRRGRM